MEKTKPILIMDGEDAIALSMAEKVAKENQETTVIVTTKSVEQISDQLRSSYILPNTKKEHEKLYKTVPVRAERKISRNEICPFCDSGKKYKKCCIKN